MNSLLITGSGSKFCGPLLQRLHSRFGNITLLSRTSSNKFEYGDVKSINFDLSVSHTIPVRTDVIIHLASFVPYNNLARKHVDTITYNLRCFHNVMRYAIQVNAKRVVFVSSTDVYSLLSNCIITVSSPTTPHNEYGLSKLLCERLGKALAEMSSLELSVVRVGPIYSENNPVANKVSSLLESLRKNRPITVTEPSNILSLLHIESASDAIAAAVSAPVGLFLVAGPSITISEFFSLAKRIYNSSSMISFAAPSCQAVCIRFDTASSEEVLGWIPYSGASMFRTLATSSA